MAKTPDPRSEREETDKSLRVEREKTDEALEEKQTALQETADKVIEVARARADRVLAQERAKMDQTMATRASGLSTSRQLKEERLHEDRAVQEERATADQALDQERAERLALLATTRQDTDEDLSSERSALDQALATRDEFLGIVSHDLRNLLGSIVGQASLISARVEEPSHDAAIRKAAKSIERAGAHMNRLVGDLLDVASIQAGVLAVTRESSHPAAVVAEAVENFQAQAERHGIDLRANLPEPLPELHFDAARILQVLTNLLSNALKFTAPGGRIEIGIECLADAHCFFVTDTGVGIASHMLKNIFDRFLQGDPSDRRGIGLGLYISRCIVEGHGGHIWAESEVGRGSSFRFTVPLQASA